MGARLNRSDWDSIGPGTEVWPLARPAQHANPYGRPLPYVVVKRGLHSLTVRRGPVDSVLRWSHDGPSLYLSRMSAIRAAISLQAERVAAAETELARRKAEAASLQAMRREEEDYLREEMPDEPQ